jgi:hypothetical protein
MPKVDKSVFFSKKLGEANYKAMAAGVAKWSEEKGITLYVLSFISTIG